MIGELISNALGAVKELFGWKREQGARENTPEMQGNAKAAADAKTAADARDAVKKGDADDIRGKLS